MHSRITLEFFWKTQMSRYCFCLQRSWCVSNEQPSITKSGLYDYLLLSSSLFHFFYFIFSAPVSFHLCFPISWSLVSFFDVLSYAFIKHSRKLLHTCIYTHTHTHTHTHGSFQAGVPEWGAIAFSNIYIYYV